MHAVHTSTLHNLHARKERYVFCILESARLIRSTGLHFIIPNQMLSDVLHDQHGIADRPAEAQDGVHHAVAGDGGAVCAHLALHHRVAVLPAHQGGSR